MSSTGNPRTIEGQVLQYLRRHGVDPGSAILIALSGGPDSLCTLSVLHELRDRYPLGLSAAYLDHGIRTGAEADRELDFVKSTCSALALDLVWDRLPRGWLEQRAADTAASLEEAARRIRYEFLRRAAAGKGCGFIALGHTADDQVETVVMRFFQGVGLSGLPGIPPERGNIIRPLIGCSRARVLSYLSDRGLAHLTDSTNQETRFLRNAVRLELLPVAERVFPGLRGSVLSLSKRMERLRAYVDTESRRRLAWQRIPGGYSIAGKQFLAVPGVLRLFSITRLLNSLVADSRRVPYRFLSRVEEDDYLTTRRVVLSGYGIRLYWRGNRLILAADVVAQTEKGYFIEETESCRAVVAEAGLCFEFGSLVRDTGGLIFRSARTGDSITLRGGSKTLKKLFAEWQVSDGWKIPIVEGRAGIVAVLGSLFGYEDRYSSGTSPDKGKALKSMVHRYDVEVE